MNSSTVVNIPLSLDTNRDLVKCLMTTDTVGKSGSSPAIVSEFTGFPFLRRNKC